ncbi:hypothetical protein BDZ94DRAFT_1248556 [Collybia nuda]|uniref:SigF-like NTF2-like domain-containing protein n=1 Tax=Collybia nuda TaxID=64659 RepID=A0A9P6CPF4_9AGAR|nr:hypothetical protein BDZ94DRAFT_1248556 [Collybia nuda]
MENPLHEIKSVAALVTAAVSPDIQNAAIRKYFTEDAGLRHPLCSVSPGPLSREDVLGVYQWYRVLSPTVDIDITNISYDRKSHTVVLEVTQLFHIRFSPFAPVPSHFIIRLTLRKIDHLFYIAFQEDFYQPDEFLNLLFPPIVPVTRMLLSASGVASTLLAKSAQVLGFWRIGGGEIASSDDLPTLGGDSSAHDSEDSRNKYSGNHNGAPHESSPNGHYKGE